VPRRRDPLLLLGIVGQYPMAGVAWQAVHYLLGFQALGLDVYYVEDSGAPPYDPRTGGVSGECDYAVSYVAEVMGRVGLGDRWVYLDMMRNETHGLSRARLDQLYRDAAVIVNVCGATAPRDEHRQGACLVYVETDPVYEQLQIALGDRSSLGFLAAHDVLFTYGENIGNPDCPVRHLAGRDVPVVEAHQLPPLPRSAAAHAAAVPARHEAGEPRDRCARPRGRLGPDRSGTDVA